MEAAARSAVETAAKTVRDLRIAEVLRQDVAIENGQIKSYRVGVRFASASAAELASQARAQRVVHL